MASGVVLESADHHLAGDEQRPEGCAPSGLRFLSPVPGGWARPERNLELSGANFAAAGKHRQPCEPASCPHAGGRAYFAATEQSRNAITGQFIG